MDEYDLKDGELALFVGYGGMDKFNMTAQVDSFLYRAKERGVTVGVCFDPEGRHNVESGRRLFPEALRWLKPHVAAYANPHP
jgi:hypothetical protein